MKLIYLALIIPLVLPGSTRAQSPATLAFVKRVKQAYHDAKNDEETASVTMWCKEMVKSFNFKDYDKAMTAAIKAMEANKTDEANEFMKRANALDELSRNLSNLVCKPD